MELLLGGAWAAMEAVEGCARWVWGVKMITGHSGTHGVLVHKMQATMPRPPPWASRTLSAGQAIQHPAHGHTLTHGQMSASADRFRENLRAAYKASTGGEHSHGRMRHL